MKKKILPIFACFMAVVMAFAIGTTTSKTAYADTTEDDVIVTESTILNKDEFFEDAALWAALVKIVERDYGGDGATIRAGDLKTATSLDLSDSNITSLSGLEYLIFSTSLKTLKLNNNFLTEITAIHIDKMLGLENLDVSNNRLETLEIPATLSLKTINARNNKLSSINLSGMKNIDDVTPAEADLRVNNFDTVSNITLPRAQDNKVSLQLAQNYLTDAVVSDFGGHNASLQLQGMHAGATQTKANIYVRITPDEVGGEYENLTAKVYYRRGSVNFQDTVNIEDNLVAESDVDGKLVLPAGKMHIRYFNNDVEILGQESNGDLYFSHDIDVYPNAPQMNIVVDGQVKNFERDIVVNKAFQVVASTGLTGAKIYVSLDSSDYFEGNTANVNKKGTYTVAAYVEYDGLKSDVASLIVRNNSQTALTWGLIIFVGVVIAIVSAVIAVRWFRNGAVVAPLTDREIRSIQNRNKNNQNKK